MAHRRAARSAARSAALVGAALVAAAGGCADGGRAQSCVEWVTFATPADAAQNSLVVRADVIEQVGTTDLYGADAHLWSLTVEDVLADPDPTPQAATTVTAGDRITVASTPTTCTGDSTYPNGDPLDVDHTVIVFVETHEESGILRTLTPDAGVVTPGTDGGIPDAWDPPANP